MSVAELSVAELFVALSSSQATALADFYQSLLGVVPKVRTSAYAEFRVGGLRIAIFEPKDENAAEFKAANSGAMSFCLEVGDLEEAIAHVTQLGYPPPGNILYASHGKEIYAYDPDGNRLILHQSVI